MYFIPGKWLLLQPLPWLCPFLPHFAGLLKSLCASLEQLLLLYSSNQPKINKTGTGQAKTLCAHKDRKKDGRTVVDDTEAAAVEFHSQCNHS